MPNPLLSTITLPSGTTYDIKDAYAREAIEDLSSYTKYLGVTTTALTDGASTNPVVINGESVTAESGNIVTYQSKEFIFNGTAWQEFGDLSGLGDFAFVDTGYVRNYKPSGTVSKPTFTGTAFNSTGKFTPAGSVAVKTAGSTTTIKNPTAVSVGTALATAAPGAAAPANAVTYYAVDGENLKLYQLGLTKENSISTSNVTVKTGDAAYEFTGTEGNVSVSGTPTGSVSQPTFDGTTITLTVEPGIPPL